MKSIHYLLLFIIPLYLGCRCDDPRDPECDNYDPCIDAVELSADFEVGHFAYVDFAFSSDTMHFVSDTLVDAYPILFRALEEADHYAWRVGDDPRVFDSRVFFLKFNGFPGDIEVTLELWNDDTISSCTEVDQGAMKQSKTIHIVDIPIVSNGDTTNWPQEYFGSFRGYYASNPSEEVTIDIKMGSLNLLTDDPLPRAGGVTNFPSRAYLGEDCSYEYPLRPFAAFYDAFYLFRQTQGGDYPPHNHCIPVGRGVYDRESKSLRIEYYSYVFLPGEPLSVENIQDTLKDYFIGTKIE